MLVILHPNTDEKSEEFIITWNYLESLPDINLKINLVEGKLQALTEIYLIGDTSKLSQK